MFPDRVTIRRFAELTGYSQAQVYSNIRRGFWKRRGVLRTDGKQLLICIQAFDAWVTKEYRRAESKAAWSKANAGKVTAYTRARQTARAQRTPTWADLEAVKNIYVEADRVSRETGIQHHVDHIVPLRGKTVSGLHVPWNLRIIPARENQRKYNKFDS